MYEFWKIYVSYGIHLVMMEFDFSAHANVKTVFFGQ